MDDLSSPSYGALMQAEIDALRARVAALEAALQETIAYCDDARHPNEQYRDARGSMLRVLINP